MADDIVITGILNAHDESGVEGMRWYVYGDPLDHLRRDVRDPYLFYPVEKGDLLKVFSDASRQEVLWCGLVDPSEAMQPVVIDGEKGTFEDMFFYEKPCILIRTKTLFKLLETCPATP